MPDSIINSIIIFLVFEFILFFQFYSRKSGRVAVYSAWYAWVIDILAMLSGGAIMFFSLYLFYTPEVFTVPVSKILFIIFFILGSWQFMIHFVKLIIRKIYFSSLKKEIKNNVGDNKKEFEKIYYQNVENYFKDIKDDGEINMSFLKKK